MGKTPRGCKGRGRARGRELLREEEGNRGCKASTRSKGRGGGCEGKEELEGITNDHVMGRERERGPR